LTCDRVVGGRVVRRGRKKIDAGVAYSPYHEGYLSQVYSCSLYDESSQNGTVHIIKFVNVSCNMYLSKTLAWVFNLIGTHLPVMGNETIVPVRDTNSSWV
jgi:hypothetical protein